MSLTINNLNLSVSFKTFGFIKNRSINLNKDCMIFEITNMSVI